MSGSSFARLEADAASEGWAPEVERAPIGTDQERVRLWGMVDGERLMTEKVAPIGDEAVLDALAATLLFWRKPASGR